MNNFAVLLVTLLCACAGAETSELSMSHEERMADFLYDPFEPQLGRSIARGDAMEKLRIRFGAPRNVVSEIANDSLDPTGAAEYLTWRYDGLTIYLQGSIDQSSRWITRIELIGGTVELKYGLGLGVNRREYESKLIPAQINRNPNSLRFDSSYTDVSVAHSPAVYTDSVLIVDFDSNGDATQLIWQYHGD